MLNELLTVEQGIVQSGGTLFLRHPEIKDAARKPTLCIFLNEQGHVAKVRAVSRLRLENKPLWKLSEGQKNNFPFVQPKPLWDNETIEQWKRRLSKKPDDSEKRTLLIETASASKTRSDNLGEWSSSGMIKSLRKRRHDLVAVEHTEGAALPAAIDRFLLAIERGKAANLVGEISDKLIEELKLSTDIDLLAVALALFTETSPKGGAFYFDVEGDFTFSLSDPRIEAPLCEHLRKVDMARIKQEGQIGICSVTGEDFSPLVTNSFSQPNLPAIRQSFLFARNEAISSASRYGRLSSASLSVGYMTDVRLRAAVEYLCAKERKGITWRAIPGESPDQRDLLLAFVAQALDVGVAGILTENDMEDDFSSEASAPDGAAYNTIAAFERRTGRLIEGIKATVTANWRDTPVRLVIIRAVDEANRKVVYAGVSTVASVYDAATNWIVGERNIPPWTHIWIISKGEVDPHPLNPPHIAPLWLINLSKQIFLRNGQRPPGKKKEQPGITAAEALKLFLAVTEHSGASAKHRAERILRMVLARRTMLLVEMAHGKQRGWDYLRSYDVHEALRTITLFGVLLYKLNRNKEAYMSDTAFRLGQLLAAADAVHAGYCADVRKGAIPPSLLGNQVFVMAQTAPAKALATLGLRWKPYDGWAKRNSGYEIPAEFLNEQGRFKKRSEIKDDAKRLEFDRAVSIKTAIAHRRKAAKVCEELAGKLPDKCNDVFRAELLLGYIAGIPKSYKEEVTVENTNSNEEG